MHTAVAIGIDTVLLIVAGHEKEDSGKQSQTTSCNKCNVTFGRILKRKVATLFCKHSSYY